MVVGITSATEVGAAAVMVDAITDLDQVKSLRAAIAVPIVYNTADTGMSPDRTSAVGRQIRAWLVAFSQVTGW